MRVLADQEPEAIPSEVSKWESEAIAYDTWKATGNIVDPMLISAGDGGDSDESVGADGGFKRIGQPAIANRPIGNWEDENSYLDGDYMKRAEPTKKCFLEAVRKGKSIFAILDKGKCYLSDTMLGLSQSKGCIDGLGARYDHDVYKVLARGQLMAEFNQVHKAFGPQPSGEVEEVRQIFLTESEKEALEQEEAIKTEKELRLPDGMTVDSKSNNLYIADTKRDRVQIIYGYLGPDPLQDPVECVNGNDCVISLIGNGMLMSDRIAVFPLGTQCGDYTNVYTEGVWVLTFILILQA